MADHRRDSEENRPTTDLGDVRNQRPVGACGSAGNPGRNVSDELEFYRELRRQLCAWEAKRVELYREFEQIEQAYRKHTGERTSMRSRTAKLDRRVLKLANALDARLNGPGR